MGIILVSGEPIPGHEIEYMLARKHRAIAAHLMLHFMKRPWHCRAYRRAYKMWVRAMDRYHQHGQDAVIVP